MLLARASKNIILFTLVFSNLIAGEDTMHSNKPIEIQTFTRKEVLPLLPQMSEWTVRLFSQYPYLYLPPKEQIINPSETIFVNETESLVVTAKKDHKMVGMAAGISLDSIFLNHHYFSEPVTEKIRQKGYDPKEILYMYFFLIPQELRKDQDLVFAIYDQFAAFAKKIGKKKICYMEIQQPMDHPLRPESYVSPEPWGETITGFESMDVILEASYPTVQVDGSTKEEKHSLLFYVKDL